MSVAIIGSGAWGTSLAVIASNNTDVILYSRDENQVEEMVHSRENKKYLPGVHLPNEIKITSNKEDLEKIDSIVLAIPSIAVRTTLTEFNFLSESATFLSVTKGLEQKTNLRMSQVIQDELPQVDSSSIAVLSGPNLAHEISIGLPAATVIASESQALAENLQQIFHTQKFRVYTTNDVIGCEIAGVAKNVVAIAVGIGDGMGFGDNAKAAVMTRALAEISRLGIAEGGISSTFYGLAGIGDLIATCSSDLSRNRTVGFQLGKGKTIDEIKQQSHDIAEGVFSAEALSQRANALNIDMPIVKAVSKVINQGFVEEQDVIELMTRPPGKE